MTAPVYNFAGLRYLPPACLLGIVDNIAKRLILLNIPALGKKYMHRVYFIKRALF